MVALELDTDDGYKTTKANQLQKGQTGIGSREPNQRNPNQLFDLAISNRNNIRGPGSPLELLWVLSYEPENQHQRQQPLSSSNVVNQSNPSIFTLSYRY
jgi:hypothetical protein